MNARLFILAGYTSNAVNPLLTDFVLVGRKLEKLRFIYSKGNVIVLDPEDAQ